MSGKINWSDAVKKIIPDGTVVELTVAKAEYKLSKKNQPMINVQFTVTDPEEYSGMALFRTFSLQPTALWALKDMLVKFDAPSSIFEDDEMDVDALCATHMPGLTGTATVSVEQYTPNGSNEPQDTNRIKTFVTSGASFDVFEPSGKK